MKYTIELNVRGKGVQLLALDEDEKDQLLKKETGGIIYRTKIKFLTSVLNF